jgi:cytochrome c5
MCWSVTYSPSQGASKTLEELYEEFQKFSRSEVSQQRKTTNENEGSRPFKYNKGKEGATSFNTACKQVHSIDSNGGGPPEHREKKTSDLCDKKARLECTTQGKIISKIEVATPAGAEAGAKIMKSLCIVCFMREILTIVQGNVLSSSNPKR